MDFNFNSKEVPAILPTFPPMPKPADFGIDWMDATLAKAHQTGGPIAAGVAAAAQGMHWAEITPRIARFKAQNEMYQQALAAWQTQVAQIAEAIRTNK